jgi:DNA invertase Pin-like site-specific DNA recombinase
LDRGIAELEEFCKSRNITLASPIFTDKMTGKTFDRPRYTVLKEDVLRSGDVLLLTEVDRLGRDKRAIVKELSYFRDKGVRVMILELPTTLIEIDSDNPMFSLIMETIQNMIIELYASMAEQEILKKEKRAREGIEAMKARGEWDKYGRPKACKWEDFVSVYEKVKAGEYKNVEAAKLLNISVPTFYRYRDKYEGKSKVEVG